MMALQAKIIVMGGLVLFPLIALLVYARRLPPQKYVLLASAAAMLALAATFPLRFGIENAEGYATDHELPRTFKYAGHQIDPPDPAEANEGTIYVAATYVKLQKRGLSDPTLWLQYERKNRHEPRLFRLPYSQSLEEALEQAARERAQKNTVQGEIIHTDEESERSDDQGKKPDESSKQGEKGKGEAAKKKENRKQLENLLENAKRASRNAKEALASKDKYQFDERRKADLQESATALRAASGFVSTKEMKEALKAASEALAKSEKDYDDAREQRKNNERKSKADGKTAAKEMQALAKKLQSASEEMQSKKSKSKMADLADDARRSAETATSVFNEAYVSNWTRKSLPDNLAALSLGAKTVGEMLDDQKVAELLNQLSEKADTLKGLVEAAKDSVKTKAAEELAKNTFKDVDESLVKAAELVAGGEKDVAKNKTSDDRDEKSKDHGALVSKRRSFNKPVVIENLRIHFTVIPPEHLEEDAEKR